MSHLLSGQINGENPELEAIIGSSSSIKVAINDPILRNSSCSVDPDRCVASCKLHYCITLEYEQRN